MIQTYRGMRVIVVSWWEEVMKHKESWSWNLQASSLYIQLQSSRPGVVKGQPCLTDVSHSWKNSLHACLSSSQAKLSGRSQQEGRRVELEAGAINKALPWPAEHWPPTLLQAWPSGSWARLRSPFQHPHTAYIHMCMQTNTEMRTFLKLPTKPDANQWLYLQGKNVILTSDFNKKFASAFVFSSVIHGIVDFVVAFWKMWPWWQAFQNNTKNRTDRHKFTNIFLLTML